MSDGWIVVDYEYFVAILPLRDEEEHIPDSSCWCEPEHEYGDKPVIVHNSADNRELIESVEDFLNK